MLDHFSSEWLLDTYYNWRANNGMTPYSECECGECTREPPFDHPTDEQLEGMLIALEAFPTEEHEDRKDAWEAEMESALSKNRPLIQKHFDLDIWLSRVCLGTSWRDDPANTTISYLILRGRSAHKKHWNRHFTEDGYVEQSYESGCGMAVAMDQHATSQDVQKFERVMRVLGLVVCIDDAQSKEKPLSLAPTTEDKQMLAVADTTASFHVPCSLSATKLREITREQFMQAMTQRAEALTNRNATSLGVSNGGRKMD